MTDMIEGPVLVLNRSFVPVQITSVKRAFCLVFKGLARFVDSEYQSYDFESWSQLSVHAREDAVHLSAFSVRLPRVIMLQFYEKLPHRHVRFNRENIYTRDRNTCQYCGKRFRRQELNLDHVVPISRGGKTNWENIVCSCFVCNNRKGGRTPDEAGMKLLSRPKRPEFSLFMGVSPQQRLLDSWRVYMNPVDFAYWCLEIRPD